MAFELPDLPYAYDALEPHIDAETMRIHHDLHHKAYVDNANAALAGTDLADHSIDSVLTNLETLPADKQAPVRNNAGGHANHSLFWQIMSPDGGGAPSGDLAKAIDDTFESVDALKAAVSDGDPAARDRRVGARVLPQVPEQAAGLSRGLVERRQLGRSRTQIRRSARDLGPARFAQHNSSDRAIA